MNKRRNWYEQKVDDTYKVLHDMMLSSVCIYSLSSHVVVVTLCVLCTIYIYIYIPIAGHLFTIMFNLLCGIWTIQSTGV